jgi:hypothetical protein
MSTTRTSTAGPFAEASPAEIRAACHPQERERFDADYQDALRIAAEQLDLSALEQTLEQWRRIAWMNTAAGHDGYRDMLARAAETYTGTAVPEGEPLGDTLARLGY